MQSIKNGNLSSRARRHKIVQIFAFFPEPFVENDSQKFLLPNLYYHCLGVFHCVIPNTTELSSPSDQELPHFPDRSERMVWVKSISCSKFDSLLLTYSGEVYSWKRCCDGQVLPYGPVIIKPPVKLPINNIISISAGLNHCFALSSDGLLYGWGWGNHEVNMPSKITLMDSPYFFKEICSSKNSSKSYGLTAEGKVIQFCNGTFKQIQGLNMHSIIFISASLDSIVAVDLDANFFFLTNNGPDCTQNISFVEIPVGKYILPTKPSWSCFLFDDISLFVIDSNGDVWRFDKSDDDFFNNKPTKVLGLSNIVSINGYDDIYAAIDIDGKVFVWGRLSRISDLYEDIVVPLCIEAFTSVKGVSLGRDFLFAYNKNTVWAWGRNDIGQLGIGDLKDRPQPVKLSCGSEILGSVDYPKQTMDRMFSGLIKLIYFEYLQYLKSLFGNHPYTKARYYTKCSISKKVAKFAKEVINGFDFLKNPQHLNLNDYIWDLQMHLSFAFHGYSVINTRIKKLDIYYDTVDCDPQLLSFLSFFPTVEVVKLGREPRYYRRLSLNLAHLSNLKCLELNCSFNIEQLPTSLVKLVLKDCIEVTDLSYLTSLKELVLFEVVKLGGEPRYNRRSFLNLPPSLVKLVLKDRNEVTDLSYLTSLKELVLFGGSFISQRILEAQIPLPLSIARLEVWLDHPVIEQLPTSLVKLVLKDCIEVTDLSYLTSLKELVLFEVVKLGGEPRYNRRSFLNLPPSLVKLVLKDRNEVTDLSYLTSLKELVLFGGSFISQRILEAQIPLPLSIARLEVWLDHPVNIEIDLPSIKELIIHEAIHTNITEQNFPSLKFIQLLGPEDNLSSSSLSPSKLDNQGLIKSTKLIKNEYLVELSCFVA
ncbi:hypothetical protein P9112_010925 [Eukaryota sp. TZLM1-RC]